MPRPCSICADSAKTRQAATMIAEGRTDPEIAAALKIGRMSVQRHRHAHVFAPAKALAEAAGKGREVREQREQVLAAAEAGDPTAFVALAQIVTDLRKVHDRLERTANSAEQDNQRLAVASLSSAQLRAAEVRAKIGSVGSYAPQKGQGGRELPAFSIVFNFSGDKTERIDMTPASPIIDMQPARPGEFTTVVDLPELEPLPADDEQDDAVEQDEDV